MAKASLAKLRKFQEHAQAFLHERTLPDSDANSSQLQRFLVFCARVYHSFTRNRCPVRAAALAYTNLLALVPLLAVAISVSAGLLKSQGQQSIQDWIREAIMKVAPTLGLKEAAEQGTPAFFPEDIKDKEFERLTARLQRAQGQLTGYLWTNRFTPANKMVLTNTALPLDERKSALTNELNKLIEDPSLYSTQRFANVILSHRTRALLAQPTPDSAAVARLNHSLLSDAFALGTDALDSVVAQIASFVANFQSGKLGVTAVLALIFVAISLLATVETTLNDIWGVAQGRGWFARVVQYWAALSLGPMFLFAALTLTTRVRVVEHLPFIGFFLKFFAPLVILSLGCALLYLVMPNTRVPWRAALLGGFVAGGLLQLNSFFNVLYVSRVLTYKQIYGSMATLPLLLLGLYFSWLLVLLGAQVAYAFQNRTAYLQEKKAQNISQRGKEFIAMRLMARIGQRFQTGRDPICVSSLAEDLAIPLRLVSQTMHTLMQAGLVLEVAGLECAYAPAKPLEQITVRDILQALRTSHGAELTTTEDAARELVYHEFETVEQSWQKAAGNVSLKTLVERLPTGA